MKGLRLKMAGLVGGVCMVFLFGTTVPREIHPYAQRMNDISNGVLPALVQVKVRFLERKRGILGDATLTEVGSGFIFDDKKGYILTTAQTLKYARYIQVILSDGKSYEGVLLGMDEPTDVAVVRIRAEKLTAVPFLPENESPRVGEPLIAVGVSSNGLFTPSFGILSALPTAGPWAEGGVTTFIQTDAPISYGMQGGPLLNFRGEVVGVLTFLRQQYKELYLHFAIPVNTVRRVVKEIVEKGRFARPWTGVSLLVVDDTQRTRYGYPYDYGLFVTFVDEGSPADKAGIRANDFLLELGGKSLTLPQDFWIPVNQLNIGDTFSVKIWRDGRILERDVTIAEWKGGMKR